MAILSGKGLDPKMVFTCCDCGTKITGQEIIKDSFRLHIVSRGNGKAQIFRCECCQEDFEEQGR